MDSVSRGFVYAVSSSSTTGKDKSFEGQQAYFERIKKLQLKNPVLIGFGIKDKATFEAASAYSNGAIIGTAFVKALEAGGEVSQTVDRFVKAIIN
ncbi:tryptophan synthase subunit alpha [Chitinophaga sedimenti]|uniref:tryptophan synthase subunit alpha n=1 Tax=Chitinophaga sedimenti TaxID=2033606 RepID=UPI0027E202AF|nr:tryptophan synthase subunit alpha [Chitinophaga sedimenti]